MALLIITILLFIPYSILIIYYRQSWKNIPEFEPAGGLPQTRISVIIPARNEEENIGRLLQALQNQVYPPELLEIIVVDDHSTDKTAIIVQQFQGIKLVQSNEDGINSYKKKAIETGIAAATGDLIVTTDADCRPSSEWIRTICLFKQEKKAVFIAAPVVFNYNHSLVELFQALDFLVLQGITGASVYKNIHSMCNGANLAYEKKVFNEVGGFTGIDHIASGDDMLLMHKIWKKHPQEVYYLKSKKAIVDTQPMKNWKSFFNQRIRWASKARMYDDKRILTVLFLVYIFNLIFPVLFIAGFFHYRYWLYLAGALIAKTVVELLFVSAVAQFFTRQSLIKYFFFLQPLHITYTIASGFLGQFGKYEWKGRKVK